MSPYFRLTLWFLIPMVAWVLFLSGCATTDPQIIRDIPPAALLEPCGKSVVTNSDLAWALIECNADKRALREWAARKPQ